MRSILAFVLIVAIALVAPFGASIVNAYWNCTAWHKATGQTTAVIAGSCYVRDSSRWELFDTYVKNHHIDIEGEQP